MGEWTTDLRRAKPGWLVEQDCVGVLPSGKTYDVTKEGHVLACGDTALLVSISALLGDPESWWLGYNDTKVRVREP